jgi:hypothetical protein
MGISKGLKLFNMGVVSQVATVYNYLYDVAPFFYGISAARQLRSGQTLVERDRRTDNTEADISFINNAKTLSSPSTVGTTLGGFVGAGDSFTDTPYDQSGNNFIVEQTVANNQPKSISNGALVTSGAKPAWDNTNGLGWKSSTQASFTDTNEIWIFAAVDLVSNGTASVLSEAGATNGAAAGGFQLTINYSANQMRISRYPTNTSATQAQYNLPSDGVHLLAFKINESENINTFTEFYVDGVQQTQVGSVDNGTTNFSSLYVAVMGRNNNFNPLSSKLQELHIYKGDQSSNRTAIEENINAYYNMYWSGATNRLYDTYPAFYGISNRALSSSYLNNVINVRRSSDNSEQHFFANYEGGFNIESIESFCGAGDGFVVSPHDQSGNGFSVEQTTAADQPKVVSSGSAIVDGNGKLQWDNTNGLGWASSTNFDLSDTNEVWFFVAINESSTLNFENILEVGGANTSSTIGSINFARSAAGQIRVTLRSDSLGGEVYVFPQITSRTLISVRIRDNGASDAVQMWYNGISQTPTSTGGGYTLTSFADAPLSVLSRAGASLPYLSKAQEFHIYKGAQSANRAAIEANINAYYNLY